MHLSSLSHDGKRALIHSPNPGPSPLSYCCNATVTWYDGSVGRNSLCTEVEVAGDGSGEVPRLVERAASRNVPEGYTIHVECKVSVPL